MKLAWLCPACRGSLAAASEEALECGGCGVSIRRLDGVWRFGEGFRPAGFRPERRAHLAELEDTHFWFPARRRLLAALLDLHPGERGETAIDLGCGTGAFLPLLAARHRAVVGVDAYAESLAVARLRAPGAVLVEGDACRVPLADAQVDAAVALDVLEHVEPWPLLEEARRLVRPGGWLLVTVPAFRALWSELDRAAGHRCRYRKDELARELRAAGWDLVHWTHYQALLFPLVWLARFLPAGRRMERRPPQGVGRLLGAVNDLEVRLFARHRLRWGSSLCALARRSG